MQSGTLSECPIFIVGSVHTGTTLVSKVLSRHPDVFGGIGETCFFHHHATITGRFANLSDEGQFENFVVYLTKLILFGYNHAAFDHTDEDYERLEAVGISKSILDELVTAAAANCQLQYGEIFGFVNRQLATLQGKSRWREKTPGHLHQVNRILTQFPQAYIIELVRDPRDILASKQKRRAKDGSTDSLEIARKLRGQKKSYDPFVDSLSWKSAVRVGNAAKKRYPKQVLEARYEDFVQNPSAETKRICDFVQLPLSSEILEEMLEVGWVNTTIAGQHGSSGIGTASISKWKNELTKAEVALCQLLVGTEMKTLGYENETVSVSAYASLPIVLFNSGMNILGQLFQKRQRGSWRHSWSRLYGLSSRLMGQKRSGSATGA